MTAHDARHATQEPIVKPLPAALLDEPLEYIFADHFRQRGVCGTLKSCADLGRMPKADAMAIAAFLGRDLKWHHQDEDEDLFPALRRRALPEDALERPLERLGKDHHQSIPMVERIMAALGATPIDDEIRLTPEVCELIAAYAAGEHRHLAIENGIVLAIARIRLTRTDLKAMSQTMKQRRGVAS